MMLRQAQLELAAKAAYEAFTPDGCLLGLSGVRTPWAHLAEGEKARWRMAAVAAGAPTLGDLPRAGLVL